MKISLPKLYSQWDSRWGNITLGFNSTTSSYNIYNYGCLITCIAMVSEYIGYSKNPSTINQELKDLGPNNGFVEKTGLYIWGASTKICPKIKKETVIRTPDPLTDAQLEDIRNSIDAGNPVMVQLDYNPATVAMEMHYVLLIDYDPADENNFLVVDPLGGVEKSLKKYLGWFRPSSRNAIWQYILFDLDKPTTVSIKDKIIDWEDPEGKRKSVGWYVYEWFTEKTKRLAELTEHSQEKRILGDQVKDLEDDVKALQVELSSLQNKMVDKNKVIEDQKLEIERLKSQNSSLFTTPDLISLLLDKIFKS